MSESIKSDKSAEKPARSRRGLMLLIGGAVVLLLAGGGAAAWFLLLQPAATEEEHAEEHAAPKEIAPPTTAYLSVPEFQTTLVDAPRVARIGIVLETNSPKTLEQGEMLRLQEEVRRYVASRTFAELHGAAATWTLRGRALAITRELYPALQVRDVLISTLIVQ